MDLLTGDDTGDTTLADQQIDEPEPNPQPALLSPGTVISRYSVLEPLGQGGMGVVYKAYDPKLDRAIALKLITKSGQGEEKERQAARLLHEAQALAQLSHPNVVAVHDAGEHQDQVFIAMELIEGQTLATLLKSDKSSREQALQIMLLAGQGLAAAHKAGLVHRDFKPSNVLIGSDGRVRVIDFGLAMGDANIQRLEHNTQGASTVHAEQIPTETMDSSSTGSRRFWSDYNQAGRISGTPLYMAPEQYLNIDLDARVDQYSFCIVLYQILYAVLPFAHIKSKQALAKRVLSTSIKPPSGNHHVSKELEAILQRGLSRDPEERFPTMDQLLAELADQTQEAQRIRTRAKRRRLVTGLVAVLALATAGGLFYQLQHQRSALCTGAQAKLQGIWDQPNKQALHKSLTRHRLSYARSTAQRVAMLIDQYLQKWQTMYTEACEATHVRGEQSEDLLDLRMHCLRQRLTSVRARIEVLLQADQHIMRSAIRSIESLDSLDNCADVVSLRSAQPVLQNAQMREQVEKIQMEIARANAQQVAGNYQQALEMAQQALEQAKQIGFAPTQAAAALTKGHALERLAKYDQAVSTLHEAVELSQSSRSDELTILAWSLMGWVVGERRGQYAEGHQWLRYAKATLSRLGHREDLATNILRNEAYLLYRQGKYQEATTRGEKVLAARIKQHGREHSDVAMAMLDLGTYAYGQANYALARQYYLQALEIKKKVLGSGHPSVASTYTLLGNAAYLQADPIALSYYQQSRDILEKTLGKNHTSTAYVYNNLGIEYVRRGDYEKAIQHYFRAQAIFESVLGPEHNEVALVLTNIGELYALQEQYHKAQTYLERALAIREKKLGPEHPELAYPLNGLGYVLQKTKQYHRAYRLHQRAVQVCRKAYGRDHPKVVDGLVGLGLVQLELGEIEQALQNLDQALTIRLQHQDDPVELARSRFALAQALARAGKDWGRARKLAKQALAVYQGMGARTQKEAQSVRTWLAGRKSHR